MANFLQTTALVCSLFPQYCPSGSLPVVDLGYEKHQAIQWHQQGSYYNFSNIRYAEPPVGDLRFKAPKKPSGQSDKINRGETGAVCPQASPAWQNIAQQFVQSYLVGFPFNYTRAEDHLANNPPTKRDPRTTEDCLFLDVHVPKTVWDDNDASAPVLVWIYGGGYVGGEKTGGGTYDPAGLLARASEPFVTVAMNYRLGAFGWMSGSDFQGEGGQGNAALADQLLALEWVQDNIHLFGGDKSRVTVMGESAGGGSIMHHITGNGGKGTVPFQQAIPQSPAFFPVPDKDQQNDSWKTFLDALGVDSLEAAQKASSSDVIRANEVAIWGAQYGTFTFGPQPDGQYVPDLPGKLLLEGKFHKDLKVMTTHVAKEGLIFTSPELTTTSELRSELKSFFHGISDDAIDQIEELYPEDDYKSNFERAVQVVEDSAFICNTNYINTGFNNKTYSFEFGVFPPLHGFDVAYTWWTGQPQENPTVSKLMQEYITSFMIDGQADSPKPFPDIPLNDGELVYIKGPKGVDVQNDETANQRCAWWQKAQYA